MEMKIIKKFEDLLPGKCYAAKNSIDSSNEYSCVCKILEKNVATYTIEVRKDHDSYWKTGEMVISFQDFKRHIWYELTDLDAFMEVI